MLEGVPMIPGDDTVFEVFEEKEQDWRPEKAAPHIMSPEAMKAVFNNLTSGASKRAEQEYNLSSATHREADFIEVSVKSARLSSQMHVTDWAEAQREDPEIEAVMDWCCFDKKKSEPWTKQLVKLKCRLGPRKNTQKGRSILHNADELTLSGELLYYRHKLSTKLKK